MDTNKNAVHSDDKQQKQSLWSKISDFSDEHYALIYSVIIVIFMYCLASFSHGVYPFGDKYTAASYDLSAQICPFIEHIFDVFQGKSSIFYSYAIAGGADVMGTFLYFFISPFSFLFLIFGDGQVAHASSIVIALKLGAIAFSGTWFAKKVFKNIPDYLCIAIGVVYAYCGYTFVSNTYINWMDFLIYLPFTISAFKRFVETGKFWRFSILMACNIYTCFSIACFSMFTVFPSLIFFGLLCVEREKRNLFLTRLCLAFVVAILISLPVLLPALKAYLASGRTGTLFENFWFGTTRDENGNITSILEKTFMDKIQEAMYRKFSYIFSDTAFVALTIVWFFRSGLKKPFAKWMLITGVMTLIPVFFDEAMLLMNMGSYMSYALRFGFLNAAYWLGGACLALDGLCHSAEKSADGTPLQPISALDFLSKEREGEKGKQKPILSEAIGGSLLWLIVFAVVFLVSVIFLLWWVTDTNYKTFLEMITDNSNMLKALDSFAGKFAHSLGGLEVIFVPCIVVAVVVFFGAILVWRKKLGLRLVSCALIVLVSVQVVFYNNVLVQGNRSTQHVGLASYERLCEKLNEMNTDEDGNLTHFRVKDYGDKFTAPAPFTGNSNSFSVFSSVIDADNFVIGELFGYLGNSKNSLKSGHNSYKSNRSDEFGDSFLGYKYYIVHKDKRGNFSEGTDLSKYVKPLMVVNEAGEEVHLSDGDFYVYENEIIFPNAFKVDEGEYRFAKPNTNNSTNRQQNQAELYKFLRGDTLSNKSQDILGRISSYVTPAIARELSEYLWSKSASEVRVGQGKIYAEVTATAGEHLMLPFVASTGYRVYINGVETTLVDNDLKFLCVRLQDGENKVEFVYNSPYIAYIALGVGGAVAGLFAVQFVLTKTKLLNDEPEELKGAQTVVTTSIAWLGILLAAAVMSFFMIYPSVVGVTKWIKYLQLL